MTIRRKLLRTGALLLVLAAGALAPVAATAEPEWVLDGTDLLAAGDVPPAPMPDPPDGDYAVEQGGSELRLSITAAGAEWTVTRSHSEPGEAAATRSYAAARKGDALASADGGLTVRGTDRGILVLETDSGTDAIPPDYWILYYPAR